MSDFITKIKVNRTSMSTFPFDVFYLVHYDHRKVLPKIFPWSLCVILGEEMVKLIRALNIDEHTRLMPQGNTQLFTDQERAAAAGRDCVEDLPKHFLLVPVLPKRRVPYKAQLPEHERKNYETFVPSYITAPRHVKHGVRITDPTGSNRFKDLFDERTILFTPKGPKCPPCLMCSRHLLQLQGKCAFGSRVCWDTMVLKGLHEQLSKDDIDADSDTDGDQPVDTLHS